jgi:long-subunit fatty acid transport protein
VPRRFENSLTASLGGELHVGAAMVQGGYAYETSAVPTGYLSVLTVDAAKHLAALGAGYEASGWSFGVAGGLVLLASRDVALDEARLPQQSPIRDQPAPVYVNAGHYDSHYLVAGVRAGRRF